MKKSLVLSMILLCSVFIAFSQETPVKQEKGLCRTYKRQGIEIYILSEPLRDYEVTGTVTEADATSWINAIAGEETVRTLTESIDVLITNANRKAKKGKFVFDAIITADGTTGSCIKFKE